MSVLSDLKTRGVNDILITATDNELQDKTGQAKWGKYLRAPDIYFELMSECNEQLVPLKQVADIRRGYTTGINEFFYLEPVEIIQTQNQFEEPSEKYLYKGLTILCKNARGWQGAIESEYLKKVIKSPKESDTINIPVETLKYFLFVCNKSKAELKRLGHIHALKYIEWGEKQKTVDGINWKDVPSVQSRNNWFNLGINEFPDYIIPCGIGETYKVFSNDQKILIDKRLYEIYSKEKSLLPLLNSTLFGFFEEAESRVSLGDGLLDLTVYEVEEIKVIDPGKLSAASKSLFKKLIEKISKRKIKSIFEEVKQKDRVELDTAVLEALGLDAKYFLPRIYDGLCEMVHERLELPKMRKRNKQDKEKFSYEEVKQSVIKDVIPNGVKQFPSAFYSGAKEFNKLDVYTIHTNGQPLKAESFFTQHELKDDAGNIVFSTDNNFIAKVAELLSHRGNYQLSVPKDEKICEQILKDYHRYKEQLLKDLEANGNTKLHDWNLAEKMAKEIMSEWGII